MSDINLSPEALKQKLEEMKQESEPQEKPAEKSLDEINIERIELLDRAVALDEEEAIIDIEKARNLLKVREILKAADEVRRIYIDELLAEDGSPLFIEYCMPTTAEQLEISEIEDPLKRNRFEVYLRIRKADPSVNEKEVYELPEKYIRLILLKIREKEDYGFLLQALRRSVRTLNRTYNPTGPGESATDLK